LSISLIKDFGTFFILRAISAIIKYRIIFFVK